MSITKEHQQALDDVLVPQEQHLQVGSCNYRLSTIFKPKEPTFQVALDVLSLTPFYPAFLITASKYASDLSKIPRHQFVDPPFEEEILTFMRELGYPGNIKLPSDVKNLKRSRLTTLLLLERRFQNQSMYVELQGRRTVQSPKASYGKRIKYAAKVTKSGKKKQPAQGLETLSEIALSEAEQIKIALERSKTQQHNSHVSGSGADEGTGVKPGVPNVPAYGSDDAQISWKSSEEEDDDEVAVNDDDDDNDGDNDDADNQDDKGQEYDKHDDEEQGDDDEQTNSDNDGDDFVHPKFSTHDEEDSFDPRVQTPSHDESTDDEDSNEEIQGANVEGDKQDEEETNEEVEANELYRDVNVNLKGRDIEMTNA
ncbi:hypothetical protein Tco_0703362 [Tanacetum coccineum]|uniref:Uncharacterized protein n=1 Tax=Tanacetum coccineum TaxID=301880 RepID=A0ABQ4XZH6_9ASTR